MTIIYLIFNERAQAWADADPAIPVSELLERINSGEWRIPEGLLASVARFFNLPEGHPRLVAQTHGDDLVVACAVPPLLERGGRPFGEDLSDIFASLPPDEDEERQLTPEQQQILKSLAAGLTTRQIAAALKRKPRYVFYQIAEMKQKLGVRTRAELVLWLAQNPG